jgi:hypothetical protein
MPARRARSRIVRRGGAIAPKLRRSLNWCARLRSDKLVGIARRGRHPECLEDLSHAATAALQSDSVRAALLAVGITPCGGTPQLFASFMATEVERWREIASRLHSDGECV